MFGLSVHRITQFEEKKKLIVVLVQQALVYIAVACLFDIVIVIELFVSVFVIELIVDHVERLDGRACMEHICKRFNCILLAHCATATRCSRRGRRGIIFHVDLVQVVFDNYVTRFDRVVRVGPTEDILQNELLD